MAHRGTYLDGLPTTKVAMKMLKYKIGQNFGIPVVDGHQSINRGFVFYVFVIFSVPSIRNLIVGWMTMTKHTMLSPSSAPLFPVAQLTRWLQFKFVHESYCFQVDTGNGVLW
jgi:hypothetical protein